MSDTGTSAKKGGGLGRFLNKYGILLIFIGICILLAILTYDNGVSIFLKFRNIVNVLRSSVLSPWVLPSSS